MRNYMRRYHYRYIIVYGKIFHLLLHHFLMHLSIELCRTQDIAQLINDRKGFKGFLCTYTLVVEPASAGNFGVASPDWTLRRRVERSFRAVTEIMEREGAKLSVYKEVMEPFYRIRRPAMNWDIKQIRYAKQCLALKMGNPKSIWRI